MGSDVLSWVGVAAGCLALLTVLREAALWWHLRFRAPRYVHGVALAALATGVGLGLLEHADEGRLAAMLIFLGMPLFVYVGWLAFGGPSAYVASRPVFAYTNGLEAGARLRLKHDLSLYDPSGRPTGEVCPAGELWNVLPGNLLEPHLVYLERPDGALDACDATELTQSFERVAAAPPTGQGAGSAARSSRVALPPTRIRRG